MPSTTTPSERIGRCTIMRRFFVRFNRPESFVHTPSSAGFTIITSGLEFSVDTGCLRNRVQLNPSLRHFSILKISNSICIHYDTQKDDEVNLHEFQISRRSAL